MVVHGIVALEGYQNKFVRRIYYTICNIKVKLIYAYEIKTLYFLPHSQYRIFPEHLP